MALLDDAIQKALEAAKSKQIKARIVAALRENGANRRDAAHALDVSEATLYRMIAAYVPESEMRQIERDCGRNTWGPGRRKRVANDA